MVQVMEKKVIIKIVDSHNIDGDIDGLETTVVGKMTEDENGYVLSYAESGELEGSSVTVKVTGGKCVTMTRTGQFETELIIEHGKRHNCSYATPAGLLMLGVFAKRVESEMTSCGGRLEFEYTLDLGAGVISENHLIITVAETAN